MALLIASGRLQGIISSREKRRRASDHVFVEDSNKKYAESSSTFEDANKKHQDSSLELGGIVCYVKVWIVTSGDLSKSLYILNLTEKRQVCLSTKCYVGQRRTVMHWWPT